MENAQDADGTTKQHGVKFANAVKKKDIIVALTAL